jgi:hypothetical protein
MFHAIGQRWIAHRESRMTPSSRLGEVAIKYRMSAMRGVVQKSRSIDLAVN